MIDPSRPAQERRRHRRFTPDKARIWCVGGEFKELYTAVNFARRLVNLGFEGMCVETTGRLRPGITMSVEIRFDEIGGTLRAGAKVVWAQTENEGAAEINKAGLRFTGPVDLTKPVREYLEGGHPAMIVAGRRAEFEDLKRKSEARKEEAAPRKRGFLRKAAATFLLLTLLYVASYWGFVLAGRSDSPKPGLRYRYFGPNSKAAGLETTAAKIFFPAYWVFRKAGVDLTYDPS